MSQHVEYIWRAGSGWSGHREVVNLIWLLCPQNIEIQCVANLKVIKRNLRKSVNKNVDFSPLMAYLNRKNGQKQY